ncbi:hypothetical protein A3D14_03400 [Candidatus Saccharibacteria bacterium RIFCSPHIGHO2_02_FULL_47_12]|nr:MAG: hypothetical protein A3D14_03400 [Candidatus Saccharibacteria bacterium RIFCSPHIGHO2_02_FULL_47_12]
MVTPEAIKELEFATSQPVAWFVISERLLRHPSYGSTYMATEKLLIGVPLPIRKKEAISDPYTDARNRTHEGTVMVTGDDLRAAFTRLTGSPVLPENVSGVGFPREVGSIFQEDLQFDDGSYPVERDHGTPLDRTFRVSVYAGITAIGHHEDQQH